MHNHAAIRPSKKVASVLVLFSCSMLGGMWAEAAGPYDMIDIGTLGGYVVPHSINDAGYVVGYSYSAAPGARAFLWVPGDGIRNLGSLSSDPSYAYDANAERLTVGYSKLNGFDQAFIWNPLEGMSALPGLGGDNSVARGVNSSGQVVGYGQLANGRYRAFVWTAENGMTQLGTLGDPHSYGLDINEIGQVTGITYVNRKPRAFVWDKDEGMKELGTLDGGASYGKAINNQGQIVGYSSFGPDIKMAFLWSEDGGMISLGTLGGMNSFAKSINDEGIVVGQSEYAGSGRGFVWSSALGMLDLNDLVVDNTEWRIVAALSINNQGEIAALAKNRQGRSRTFVLIPR